MKFASKIVRNIISAIIVFVLFIVLIFVFLSLFYTVKKKDFKEGFKIPGLSESYNPQNVVFEPMNNILLQTAYISKTNQAVILVMSAVDGKVIKEVGIKNANNTPYTKKASGIATDGSKVWITSDYEVNEFYLHDIINTSSDSLTSLGTSRLIVKGDFCYYDDHTLWIGEYAFKPFEKVEHDEPLLMAFDTGNLNYSMPKTVVTLPSQVRAMISIGNEFYVTRSYNNFMNSSLVSYKILLGQESEYYSIEGNSIPLFHFNKDTIQESHYLPPMARGLYYKDDYINILFESGSKDNFYSFPKIDTYLRYRKKMN